MSQHVYTSTSFLVELFQPFCGFLYVCSSLLYQVCRFLVHLPTHTSVSYGLFLLALVGAKLQIHSKVLRRKLLSPCFLFQLVWCIYGLFLFHRGSHLLPWSPSPHARPISICYRIWYQGHSSCCHSWPTVPSQKIFS